MIFNFNFISIYVALPNYLPAILLKILPRSFMLHKKFVSLRSNEKITVIIEQKNST